MDQAIYQDDGYLFAVLRHQIWVVQQGELLKMDIFLVDDLADDLADDRMRVFAQVAAWAPDQGNLYSLQNPQPPFITILSKLLETPW